MLNEKNIDNAVIISDNHCQQNATRMSYIAKDYLHKNIEFFTTTRATAELEKFLKTYKHSIMIIAAKDEKDLKEKKDKYESLLNEKLILIHSYNSHITKERLYFFNIK